MTLAHRISPPLHSTLLLLKFTYSNTFYCSPLQLFFTPTSIEVLFVSFLTDCTHRLYSMWNDTGYTLYCRYPTDKNSRLYPINPQWMYATPSRGGKISLIHSFNNTLRLLQHVRESQPESEKLCQIPLATMTNIPLHR